MSSTLPFATLLSVAALAAAPPHADAVACGPRTPVTPAACFPSTLAGTFSGQDDEHDWWASVTLRRHRQQTINLYAGRATVHWEFRSAVFAGGRCHYAPAGGSFAYRVELQNRVPDRRRGWSYAGGGPAGDAGESRAVCAGGDEPVEDTVRIARVCDVGGFTRSLRRVGGQTREAGAVLTWRLRAGG